MAMSAAISIVNAIAGWTVIGWIIVLVVLALL
jgi:hypothetical protein